MKRVLFGNRVIVMLLCLIMLSGVILTSCNKGSDTPAETSGKATVTDAVFKPEETRTPEIAAETVSFDQTAVTMTVGDTVALVATVLPSNTTDKSITYSSSNPAVAVAVNGTVTAAGVGTAVIIATTSNGKTAICTVTVTSSTVAVSGISLDKPALSLVVGDTEVLTAAVMPADATDKTVTWTSSDTAVATVENGIVTAKKAGTAVVIATTSNGKTASCTVTVSVPTVDVTGVTLNKTELSLSVGGSATLAATVAPANATVKTVTWRSSDALVITVKNGVVTAVGVGTATVTVTTSNGKTATCTVTVKEKVIPSGLNFALTLNDSFYIVTGYYGNATEYTIPAIYDGLRVIGIQSNAFRNNTNLKKITIPSNIEVIGASAFAGCTALAEIVIPESVTKIEESTFSDCTSLKEIRIHGKIKTVGSNAFAGCIALTDLTIENGVTEIGAFAFDRCTGLVSVELPDSVTLVGNGAFRHAEALETVKLSKNMTAINNITFQYCESLKSVSLHSGITQIGNSAFSFCYGLEKLEILGNLTDIGNSAFYHCEKLNEIFYASKIGRDLGKTHYTFCRAGLGGTGIRLTIAAGAVLPEGLFEPFEEANRPKITEIVFEDGTEQVEYFAVYSNFTYLKKITIPHSVKSIPSGMLKGCADLTLAMEDEHYTFLAWYDNSAFAGDAVNPTDYAGEAERLYAEWKLKQFTIILNRDNSDAGEVAGGGIYDYGETVTIKATTKERYTFIGWYTGDNFISDKADYSFEVTQNMTLTARWRQNEYNVSVGKNLSEAGSVSGGGTYPYHSEVTVKADTNITHIFLGWYENGTRLTTSLEYTFTIEMSDRNLEARWKENDVFIFEINGNSCVITGVKDKSATEYIIPDYVTEIGYSAFHSCSGLTSITIPDDVTSIGNSAFYGCSGLTSITIPDGVTSIGDYAFYFCSSLTSITIPGGVTSIGNSAFLDCSGLTSITIPDGVTSIGSYAFYGCSGLTSITIPDGVTSIGDYAFSDCSGLTSIVVAEGNKVYHSFKNCLIETQCKTLILGCRNSEIPPDGSVTSIGNDAFRNCSSLKSITIPNGVTSIGDDAFCGCSGLTSITIQNGVTSIGNSAFYHCSSLKSITIPNGVTSIGDSAFLGCSSLTSITIPDGATSIGNLAFYDCSSLTSITIPDSVTSIGYVAFFGCSRLTSITFEDTSTWYTTMNEADWTNKSGGTVVDVSDPTKNATTFRNSGSNYWYWYKL